MTQVFIESDTQMHKWEGMLLDLDRVPIRGEFVEVPTNHSTYEVDIVKHYHQAPATVILKTR